MRAALIIVALSACGGTTVPEPTRTSPEASSSSPADETRAADVTADAEPDLPTPVVNRSAGPARPGAAIVPQHGHRDTVSALVALPGGRAAAGTMSGGLVTVFDVPSGRIRASRRCFRGSILDILPNADGSRLLIRGTQYYGPEEPHAGIWDLRNDTFRRIDDDGERRIGSAAISPDGERVALLVHVYGEDDDDTFLEIGPSDGQGEVHRRRLEGGSDVRFLHDGATVAVVGDDHVRLMNAETGALRGEREVAGARYSAVHPNEPRIAVGGGANAVVVDARGRVVGDIRHRVTQLAFDTEGDRLASCTRTGRLLVHSGARYADESDPVVTCSQGDELRFRGEPMVVDTSGRMEVRRPGTPAVEIAPLDNDVHSVAFPSGRGQWFLLGSFQDVHIYNLRRQRMRRLIRGGASERSAWRVERREGAFRLVGKDWHVDFGAAAETPGSEQETVFPHMAGEHYVMSTSADGQARVAIRDPYGDAAPVLLLAGQRRPVSLPIPRDGFGTYCSEDEGDGELYCNGRVEWGMGNRFVVSGDEALASYDDRGRRRGVSTEAMDARFSPDGETLLLRFRSGAMTLTDLRLRRRARVFNARQGGVQARGAFGVGLLAATRGRVLQIVDVATGEQKHRIELPAPAVADPVFQGQEVQLQTRRGFHWFAIESGDLTRQVELSDVRALNESVSEALDCADGRLRHRRLADGSATDLAPCPQRAAMGFDDDFVWWVQGNAGRVLRRSDGQQITLRALKMRRDVMAMAITPEGHLFLSRTDAMGELLLREPGPLLEAAVARPEASQVVADLVQRFIAGTDLGTPPAPTEAE